MSKKAKAIYSIYFMPTGDLAYMDRKPTEDDLKAIVWKNEWLDCFDEDEDETDWKEIKEQLYVSRHEITDPSKIKIKSKSNWMH